MYSSLYVILILQTTLDHINARSSKTSHCRIHLRRHQPSVGHHLLGIEYSIHDGQVCEHRCTSNHLCSMATFNRQSRRCHLFQPNQQQHSLSKSYRTNHLFSTFANCPGKSNIRQTRGSDAYCIYDSLPWQQAQRSIVFQSYTLIGTSHLPCQELCSSVRYCAGVQYQKRGAHRNRCRLLRSTKPWDLAPSQTWTVFSKRSCHVQIHRNDLSSDVNEPACNFEYFGQGQHKHDREMIHRFSRTSKIQCEYLCSKMVNCIGIELIERRSQCILLSPNFVQNDGSIDLKFHRRHHIYMKASCGASLLETSSSECPLNDIHCRCQQTSCQHGRCLSRQQEGYEYMFCDCDHGFTGHLCDRRTED